MIKPKQKKKQNKSLHRVNGQLMTHLPKMAYKTNSEELLGGQKFQRENCQILTQSSRPW